MRLDEATTYESLAWAGRNLNFEEFQRTARVAAGERAPAGEYLDARTGELVIVGDEGEDVPNGTVYLALDSLRDQGIWYG